ncbi:hypothetical protein [Chryseobacterium nakagawai]|nr:hypothetical protein [Chryseobacterium nakagawai]
MKNLLFLFLITSSTFLYCQNFSDIEEFSKYIGKDFNSIQNDYKLSASESGTEFGIDSKVYKYKSFAIIISEIEDNNLIGEINLTPISSKNNSEIWYQNIKETNSNHNYFFVKAFIKNEKDSFFDKTINYNELIKKVREIGISNDVLTEICYKKDMLYYSFSLFRNSFSVKISSDNPLKNF